MSDVTDLLLRWNRGDKQAQELLIGEVFAELNVIAEKRLAGESDTIELQPGGLVNETYLRLIDMNRIEWRDRAHFLAMAARIMRQILVDDARKRHAAKRHGGVKVTLTGLASKGGDPSTDTMMLHDALQRLAEIDPERAQLVELRFFGGMTIEETAEVLGKSPATVKRSWEVSRGWLYRELTKND